MHFGRKRCSQTDGLKTLKCIQKSREPTCTTQLGLFIQESATFLCCSETRSKWPSRTTCQRRRSIFSEAPSKMQQIDASLNQTPQRLSGCWYQVPRGCAWYRSALATLFNNSKLKAVSSKLSRALLVRFRNSQSFHPADGVLKEVSIFLSCAPSSSRLCRDVLWSMQVHLISIEVCVVSIAVYLGSGHTSDSTSAPVCSGFALGHA